VNISPSRDCNASNNLLHQSCRYYAARAFYPGVTHEFFGAGAVVPAGKAAEDYASKRLRQSLTAVAPMPAMAEPMHRGRRMRSNAGGTRQWLIIPATPTASRRIAAWRSRYSAWMARRCRGMRLGTQDFIFATGITFP